MTLIQFIKIFPGKQAFYENINAYNTLAGFIIEPTFQLCNLTLKKY